MRTAERHGTAVVEHQLTDGEHEANVGQVRYLPITTDYPKGRLIEVAVLATIYVALPFWFVPWIKFLCWLLP